MPEGAVEPLQRATSPTGPVEDVTPSLLRGCCSTREGHIFSGALPEKSPGPMQTPEALVTPARGRQQG